MKRAGLAATIKARWICEQAHQQLKEKLGLDHFEPASKASTIERGATPPSDTSARSRWS
jgi:SRSO17 transposase